MTATRLVVLGALLVVATLFGHVTVRALLAAEAVAAAEADTAAAELHRDLDGLTVTIGELGDPERIAAQARSLGLEPAATIWRVPAHPDGPDGPDRQAGR